MAPSNCWIVRAVWLACLFCCGSCRRIRESQLEPIIFKELCSLKDEPGPCKAIKDRFFFNVNTGLCELFEYGGCGGNANNFETKEECEESCVVSDDKSPCHLPESPGPCRGLVRRYFFDSSAQECKPFFYGGCFGNANNFRRMSECRARCPNPVTPIEAAEDDAKAARRVGLVQPTVRTENVTTSGSVVQQQDPQPVINEICSAPAERGTCLGSERRFTFDPERKRCQPFSYSGCGGNGNNFLSRRLCFQKCIKPNKGHKNKMIRIKKKNLKYILNRSA